LRISADFVTSAARASGLPGGGLPELALVGRSNVGKSSLINALTRRTIARASAAPGKTRLANVYRVRRGNAAQFYLVDLPGYGYAGGGEAARAFEELTRGYFDRARADTTTERGVVGSVRRRPDAGIGALLVVDARHPGLDSDVAAWHWLKEAVAGPALVATKIDKLPRGQRIRAVRELESVFDDSVLPVSAVTGEGLDELWNQIDRLVNSLNPQPRRSRSSQPPPKATAARPPKK
jgi:GTP-binding protein